MYDNSPGGLPDQELFGPIPGEKVKLYGNPKQFAKEIFSEQMKFSAF
jgi:hypothetical protein